MDNYAIKSVTFGGFDKQDVIHYIEQTSKEAAENLEKLRQERDSLQTEAESLRSQVRELQTRLEAESSGWTCSFRPRITSTGGRAWLGRMSARV